MRFFSLRQTSRTVLLSMSGLALTLSAHADTTQSAQTPQTSAATEQSVASEQINSDRLTPANSTDGIIALVNENAILKAS